MAEKISPGLVIVGGLVGLVAVVGFAALAMAAPPTPLEYPCPYCPVTFDTYEELVYHLQTEHPGERIPLPIEWD